MLEVRELKKIYKTKNSAAVNALDGVSVQFPEKGMVFLLGKSGSGKSTLLNVCGGLDNPTSGEIIVKGRSSKDFSQSDFDSYRNTFVGFIFQEYNILNEFSVEDNIALALELQGKPKDKAAIAALLEEVDLTGYAKRKPNTLSGGQKQRIAIARALVKKPEIIMADEPTGALDSNTGKQVFDTLKKLSKTKLVIVVSHDRDFAEQYGDRIIELSDGKILSDVSKTHANPEEISSNLKVLGDVLCIKKGADLTENDFDSIKKFLKKSDSDVVIASDEKSVKTFKSAARITDDGQREVFEKTDESATPQKQYTREDSRFIRSKLPMRHAFKIGASGLRTKPVRLFFTVLLCSVAFILFGLLSTLNFYNSEATFKQTARDSEVSSLKVVKHYEMTYSWYRYGEKESSFDGFNQTRFTAAEVKTFAEKLNANAFGALDYGASFNLRQIQGSYWQNYIRGFAYLPEGNELYGKLQGEYPTKSNEIVITSYFADMFVECGGYDNTGSPIELTSRGELVGKSISINGYDYKITGIIDSGEIPSNFDALKEANNDFNLQNDYASYLNSSYHGLVFVAEDVVDTLSEQYEMYKEGRENYMNIAAGIKYGGEYSISDYANARYNGVSALPASKKLYAISGEGTSISDNEIILPTNRFLEYLSEIFTSLVKDDGKDDDYLKNENYYLLSSKCWDLYSGGVHVYDEKTDESTFVPFTDAEYDARMAEILKAAKDENVDLSIAIQLYDNSNSAYIGDMQIYNICAVYKTSSDRYDMPFYLSDKTADELWNTQKASIFDYSEIETEYVEPDGAKYSYIYLPGDIDEEKIDTYWEIYSTEEADENSVLYRLEGNFISALSMVDSFVKNLSTIFLYVGLVLAIFAALLLSNFISVSISNKKRDIGILRAVGARSLDVFKIFFSESFVIGGICVAISCVASYVLCNIINKEYSADLGASVFVFGPASIIVLVAIAVVTIIISTFLPVYNAAKKKPVDSIRSL